ncbi:MAG: RNA polymerase sigma factor [Planctomycetota bacterium]|nr:RNA polymerase sigma factor [Planctomycetota bacterium]
MAAEPGPKPPGFPLNALKEGELREYTPDPMEAETTRLMTATKNGDTAAFDELIVQLRGRAFTVAHVLVGSREDALDLCQEAFFKTYRARDTYRESEPFLPWFHRILRNTCFSFLRKHRRLKHVSLSGRADDQSEWEIADDEPGPHHGAEHGEMIVAFRRAYEKLSARDREILALRHFRDLSYREIAHSLDIPEGTVMSRLFHARRRLREELRPQLREALSDYAHSAPEES